jgi:hypothetical protein
MTHHAQFEYTDQYNKYGVQHLRKWGILVGLTPARKHSVFAVRVSMQ